MAETVKVLGFSGSLRKKSHNSSLLRAAQELKPESMVIEIFELSDIPMYNTDVENSGEPDAVSLFKNKIAESDSLLIASPEYNTSVTGILKNAIDWASRPPSDSVLNMKPYAIMGVSGGMTGAQRSQSHFRQIASFCNMFGMNKPEVYVAFGKNKFNEKGELTDDPTREHLKKFLAAFYEWTVRLKV